MRVKARGHKADWDANDATIKDQNRRIHIGATNCNCNVGKAAKKGHAKGQKDSEIVKMSMFIFSHALKSKT